MASSSVGASCSSAWSRDGDLRQLGDRGFGALAHEYATALGFTLVAVGVQVIFGSFFVSLLTMRTGEPSRARVVENVPVT